MEVECELVEMKKNTISFPAYEFTCPFCNSKQLFDQHLMDMSSSVFCHFCNQKIMRKEN